MPNKINSTWIFQNNERSIAETTVLNISPDFNERRKKIKNEKKKSNAELYGEGKAEPDVYKGFVIYRIGTVWHIDGSALVAGSKEAVMKCIDVYISRAKWDY